MAKQLERSIVMPDDPSSPAGQPANSDVNELPLASGARRPGAAPFSDRAAALQFGTEIASEPGQLGALLAAAIAERDAYQQEMFESDRVAAHLALERQNLLDELARAKAQLEVRTQQFEAMRRSTFWRLLYPARLVAAGVREFVRGGKSRS